MPRPWTDGDARFAGTTADGGSRGAADFRTSRRAPRFRPDGHEPVASRGNLDGGGPAVRGRIEPTLRRPVRRIFGASSNRKVNGVNLNPSFRGLTFPYG